MKAAVYGTIAGILFGLSATITKPVVETLHQGISEVLSDWQLYVLIVAGALGFILQQVSLGTGRLAPSVATVSVANPIVSILLGVSPAPGEVQQADVARRRRTDRARPRPCRSGGDLARA